MELMPLNFNFNAIIACPLKSWISQIGPTIWDGGSNAYDYGHRMHCASVRVKLCALGKSLHRLCALEKSSLRSLILVPFPLPTRLTLGRFLLQLTFSKKL